MPPVDHAARRPWRGPALGFCALVAGASLLVAATPLAEPSPASERVSPGEPIEEDGFAGAQACKVCHNSEEQERRWDTWMNTAHADAHETLKSAWSLRIAQERGLTLPPAEAPECLRCHVTGYDTARSALPPRIAAIEGVQCETCHAPGGKHVLAAQRRIVDKDESAKPGDSIDMPDKDNCLQCHNTESPTWDPRRYILEDGTTTGFDYRQARRRSIHPETDMRPARTADAPPHATDAEATKP